MRAGIVPASERPPLPAECLTLLARSDGELVAAQMAAGAAERLLHGHLAALRAGAALLQVTGRPGRRPALRTVWEMLDAVAPELSGWTAFFAAEAPLRAALETGRADVDDARADRTVRAAEQFADEVREVLARHGASPAAQGALVQRAS